MTYEDVLKKYGLSASGQTNSRQNNTASQTSSTAMTYEDVLKKYGLTGNQQQTTQKQPVNMFATAVDDDASRKNSQFAQKWYNEASSLLGNYKSGKTVESDANSAYEKLIREELPILKEMLEENPNQFTNAAMLKNQIDQLEKDIFVYRNTGIVSQWADPATKFLQDVSKGMQIGTHGVVDYSKKAELDQLLNEETYKYVSDIVSNSDGLYENPEEAKKALQELWDNLSSVRSIMEERQKAISYDDEAAEKEIADFKSKYAAQRRAQAFLADYALDPEKYQYSEYLLAQKDSNIVPVQTDDEYRNEVVRLREEHNQKAFDKKFWQYNDLMGADDFEAMYKKGVAETGGLAPSFVENSNQMTAYEIMIYNYLYGKKGFGAAAEYIDFLSPELKRRQGTEIGNKISNMNIPVVEQLAMAAYGFSTSAYDFLARIPYAFSILPKEYEVYDYANQAYQVSDENNAVSKYLHQGAITLGNMVPAIATSYLTGGGTLGALATNAMTALSTKTASYRSALEDGMSPSQANDFSSMVALSEVALGTVLDTAFGTGAVTGMLEKSAENITRASLKASANLAIRGFGEVIEEGAQLFLEPLYEKIVTGKEYTAPEIEEIIETVLMSFATSVAGETVTSRPFESARAETAYKNFLGEMIIEADMSSELKRFATEKAKAIGGKEGEALLSEISKIDETGYVSKGEAQKIGQLIMDLQSQNVYVNDIMKTAAEARLIKITDSAAETDVKTPATDAKVETANPAPMDVYESTLAAGTNASADPVATAIGAFNENGNITNKQIQDILNSTTALDQLREKTGNPIKGTTEERSNAVLEAVAKLARESATPDVVSPTTDATTPDAVSTEVPTETAAEGMAAPVAPTEVAPVDAETVVTDVDPSVRNPNVETPVVNTVSEKSADSTETDTPSTTESVGAATDTDVSTATEETNTEQKRVTETSTGKQRSRPDDVRPMGAHKVDPYGREISEFVGDAYAAEITPDDFTATINDLEDAGALGHDKKTNAESVQEAYDRIKKRGFEATKKDITKSISNGKIGETDIATAMLLYNHYVNRKGAEAQDSAAELFVDLGMMATQTGRDLQLFKMLRKLTPEGQLMAVTKNVKRYVDNINKGRKKRNQANIEIPKELQNDYMEAAQQAAVTDTPETQQRKQEAEQAIYEYAASNIKATFEEKWNAWRYMAMLGNPKTQIRNMVGNAAFRPFVETKRYIGAALEAMFLKPENRTKAVLGLGENDRALLKWAREDARSEDTAKRMEYTGQTGDSANTDIDDLRTIFDNKALEKARTGLQDLMSAEDMLFKRGVYSKSLASFLKARGVTAQQLEAGDVKEATLNAARDYATKEAMKATFNDRNAVSDFVTNNFRYKGNNTFGKMANAMAEGVIPFRRTPANILVRGLEYNPAALLRSVTTDIYKVAKGEISGATYIDNISAALTGTGAFGIGFALAAGVIEGVRLVGNVEDEDEKRTGRKSYALEIGGRTYPIEWAAPTAFPLFIGANFYDNVSAEGNDDVGAITAFLDAAANTLEPVLELSTLSSLNDLITDARYAEEGKEIYSILASAATSYFMQALPTIGGQVEQAFEDEKKSVYADSSDPVYSEIQKILGRATQKIPGIDLYQIEKTDAWGRTEEKGRAEKIFDAFINPSNDQPIIKTDADIEIMRLNKEITDGNVSPDMPSKTVSITDETGKKVTKRLSGEEYEALSKTQGQKQKELVEAIIADPAYAGLSDRDKAKAIGFAYDYARDYARGEVIDGHEGITTAWMQNAGDDPAGAIMSHVAASTFSDPMEAMTKSWKKGEDNETAVADLEGAWTNFQNMSPEMQEAVLSEGGRVKEYITARQSGMSAEDFAGSYRVEYTTGNAFDSLTASWKKGEDNTTAAGELEDAWTHYQSLSYKAKNALKENLTGRDLDYITARESGISAETFTSLYKTYYDLKNSTDKTANEKAAAWSLALERAQNSGNLTSVQKNVLKDELYFTQSLRAKSAQFDEFVQNGIPAEKASYVDAILKDLTPKSGKSTVTNIQKIEAVANADRYLTESQQRTAMKSILDDNAYAKYQKVLALGMDTDDYAESYQIYLDLKEAGGERVKARTIEEFQNTFDITYTEAKDLYEIYKPK